MFRGKLSSKPTSGISSGTEVKKQSDYRLYLLSTNDAKSIEAIRKIVKGGNAVLLYPDLEDKSNSKSRKYKACFIKNGSLREAEVSMGNREIRATTALPCDLTNSLSNADNLMKATLARAGIAVAPILKTPESVFRAHTATCMDPKSLASFAISSSRAHKWAQPLLEQRAVRKLFTYILDGEIAEVKKMLDANPRLALVKWTTTKEEEKVTTNKGGQRVQIQGRTAYQIALGEEDTEMAAILKTCIVREADEKEANTQFNNQFPKDEKQDWEADELKRWQPLFDQLNTLTEAIRTANPGDIVSSGDPEYKLTIREGSAVALALAQYRALWDSILNEVVTTGRHYNPKLLQQAFQIYDDNYEDYFGNAWSDPRAMCFWQQAIGYAERPMPANYVQAFCDGLGNTAEKLQKGVPQGRSFKFEVYDSARRNWAVADFYPLSSSRLGFDFAIYGGGRAERASRAAACCGRAAFSKLMSIKSSRLTEPMHRYQNGPSKATMSCVIM